MGNQRELRFGRSMGAESGWGFGRGFGYNQFACAALTEEGVKTGLQERRDFLKARLEMIDKRLASL